MRNTIIILVLLSGTTVLAQPPVMLEGHAEGTWWLFHDYSPTPVCGLEANEILGPGEIFEMAGDLPDYPCNSSWFLHAGADSLVYRGEWSVDNPTDYVWNFSMVDFTFQVTLETALLTRVFAASMSQGVLEADSHLVTVVSEGQEGIVLLGPSPEGAAELVLAPGIHTITLEVDVTEHHTHYDYLAGLKVWWETDQSVHTDRRSWSALKAIYR